MEDLKISAIQFDIVWEDKAANFKKLEEQFLSESSLTESDLIVLPEMFATGFTMKPHQFWEDENGITFQWMMEWAKKLNVCIGGGLITKKTKEAYYNTFLVVHPNGECDQYDKRHLFRMGAENEHYVKGSLPKIIQLKGWKINLQICYDLRFPVFSRNNFHDNEYLYDALIYIANWPAVRTYAWTNLLQARAIENQAYVIGVNRVGFDNNKIKHIGESASIDCKGQYLQLPVANTERIFTSVLKRDELQKIRTLFPVLIDADSFDITDK